MAVDAGPVTAGQVSFLLGIIPVFITWIYAEYLEYKKSSLIPKAHSDSNLVELGGETIKEDDRAVLLEGGLSRSASSKFNSSSIKLNLMRFLTMEDSFLLEHRLTLRLMSELGAILFYFYICDRTDILKDSTKKLFLEAVQKGTRENFYRLISYFQTQSEPAYCGLASL